MKLPGDPVRMFDCILKAGGALAGLLMIAIMLMVCIKVFMRYVLGAGWIGVDQISGSMLLYITFLGAGWVLLRDKHVTIDIVYGNLSENYRRTLTAITSAVCAVLCLLLFIYSANEVIYSWNRGFKVAAELEIPRAFNLVVIPLGALFLFLQFIRRALNPGAVGQPGEDETQE